MAALTPASRRILLLAGLALLQGCGSCVEDPNAKKAPGEQAGSVGPAGGRFNKTAIPESSRPPLHRLDAQAD
jgi:hypothetical protein